MYIHNIYDKKKHSLYDTVLAISPKNTETMRIRQVLLFCLISIANNCVKALPENQECTTSLGDRGQRVSISDCPLLLEILQKEESDKDEFKYFKASILDVESNGRVIVCCVNQGSFEDTFLTENSCGYQELKDEVKVNAAGRTEFPWLALLEQTKTSGDKILECGGVLISPQYVLTAAHCVVNTTSNVTSTRLGEWNLDTQDCMDKGGYKECFSPSQDIRIEEIITHKEYYRDSVGAVYNDIALIRLVNPATINEFVRPICLPTASERSNPSRRVYIAGWGVRAGARYNPTKQILIVPIEKQSECSSKYKQLGVNITTKQICAGGEEGKDSCIGDSGGPLMTTTKNNHKQYYVEGIASYGRSCTIQGWPEVYTRVTEYLKWIRQNVKS